MLLSCTCVFYTHKHAYQYNEYQLHINCSDMHACVCRTSKSTVNATLIGRPCSIIVHVPATMTIWKAKWCLLPAVCMSRFMHVHALRSCLCFSQGDRWSIVEQTRGTTTWNLFSRLEYKCGSLVSDASRMLDLCRCNLPSPSGLRRVSSTPFSMGLQVHSFLSKPILPPWRLFCPSFKVHWYSLPSMMNLPSLIRFATRPTITPKYGPCFLYSSGLDTLTQHTVRKNIKNYASNSVRCRWALVNSLCKTQHNVFHLPILVCHVQFLDACSILRRNNQQNSQSIWAPKVTRHIFAALKHSH